MSSSVEERDKLTCLFDVSGYSFLLLLSALKSDSRLACVYHSIVQRILICFPSRQRKYLTDEFVNGG